MVDDSDTHNPGYKFNEWEMRGVPVRIELGANDMNAGEVRCVIRHSGEKFQMSWVGIEEGLRELLNTIHSQMYQKALAARDSHLKTVDNWDEFMKSLNSRNICLADWCDEVSCEERIKN